MEIERKFLVSSMPPEVAAVESIEIAQGYLAVSSGVEVRIRRRGHARVMTVKAGAGLLRHEVEWALDAHVFDRLWPVTEGRRVEKQRRIVPLADSVAEVDEFAGHLGGLIVAEVEFASEDEARRFEPPAWFGVEVTDDERFSNARLANAAEPPPT